MFEKRIYLRNGVFDLVELGAHDLLLCLGDELCGGAHIDPVFSQFARIHCQLTQFLFEFSFLELLFVCLFQLVELPEGLFNTGYIIFAKRLHCPIDLAAGFFQLPPDIILQCLQVYLGLLDLLENFLFYRRLDILIQ